MNPFIKIFVVGFCLFYFLPITRAQDKSFGNTHKDTLQINDYLTEGKKKFDAGSLDSAELLIKKAYNLSKRVKNGRKTIQSIFQLNYVLRERNKYPEALVFANESFVIAKQLKDPSLIIDAYIRIGAQHYNMGGFKEATANFLSALELAENENDGVRQLKANNNLTAIFIVLKDKKKAPIYARKSYELAKKLKDSVTLTMALMNIASVEGENGNYEQEAQYLNEAVSLGYLMKDYSYLIDAYMNLGVTSKHRKNNPLALVYYTKALETSRKYNYTAYDIYINMGMAEGLQNVGRYKEGLVHIEKSLQLARKANTALLLRDIYFIKSGIYEDMGNASEALKFLKKGDEIKDSLVRVETEKTVNKMENEFNTLKKLEFEYQTVKKEKAISDQRLTISKNKLELQEKNRYILFAVFAILILAAISATVYLFYSSKHKADQQKLELIEKEKDVAILEAMITGEEKERSRLALNLHDGIGGILSVTKMQMELLLDEYRNLASSPVFEKTVSMIDTASVEARAIAHNLAPQILFQKGLDAALDTFCKKANSGALEVIYYTIGDIGRFSAEFELFIYRTVQEGLNNIIKHAKATKVIIQLSNNDGILNLTIEDDGVGMDVSSIGINGIGLSNLRSRTIAKGGVFEITSSPNSGTTIYLEFDTKRKHLIDELIKIDIY